MELVFSTPSYTDSRTAMNRQNSFAPPPRLHATQHSVTVSSHRGWYGRFRKWLGLDVTLRIGKNEVNVSRRQLRRRLVNGHTTHDPKLRDQKDLIAKRLFDELFATGTARWRTVQQVWAKPWSCVDPGADSGMLSIYEEALSETTAEMLQDKSKQKLNGDSLQVYELKDRMIIQVDTSKERALAELVDTIIG